MCQTSFDAPLHLSVNHSKELGELMPAPELVIRRVVASMPEMLRAFGNNETDSGEGTILHADRFQVPVYCEVAKGAAFHGICLELEAEEIPNVGEHVKCEQIYTGSRGRLKATAWTYLPWWENAGKLFGVYRRHSSAAELVGRPYTGILELSADWPTDIWDGGIIHYSTIDGAAYELREFSNGNFVSCRVDPRIPEVMLPESYMDREVLPQ
jgi:hypothetical protein